MEITLKVVLSADANFLAALQALAGQKSDGWKPIEDSNGTETKPEKRTRKTPQEKTVAAMEKEEVAMTATEKIEETTHTLDSLRAIAVPLSKAGHKDAIKTKIAEMGYPGGLPTIEPKDFQAFFDYLQTLN